MLQPKLSSWLGALNSVQLHRLAVMLGTPCSGTKAARVTGIQGVLPSLQSPPSNKKADSGGILHRNLSIVSLDMGIRNLAYAHLTASAKGDQNAGSFIEYGTPTLQSWRRISIPGAASQMAEENSSYSKDESDDSAMSSAPSASSKSTLTKESFEPRDYAVYAYDFVKQIITHHSPTHVLIERQRFRSGGNSAVQEWTIRVGVFEGMLYAALKTLIEETKAHIVVEPVLPARVNRYWLDKTDATAQPVQAKSTGKAVKKAKIDLVGRLLREADTRQGRMVVSDGVKPVADGLLSKLAKKKGTRGKSENSETTKLDDLSDCLLQGLAWIDWSNNRSRLENAWPRDISLSVPFDLRC